MPPKKKAVAKSRKTTSTAPEGVSECCICSNYIVDGQDDALFCEGECSGWMHRYCSGVPLKLFEKLTSTSSPFFFYSCALQKQEHETALLKKRVVSLTTELEDLRMYLHDKGSASNDGTTKGEYNLKCTQAPIEEHPGYVSVLNQERGNGPRGNGETDGVDGCRGRGRVRGWRQGGKRHNATRANVSSNNRIRDVTVVSGVRRIWGTMKSSSYISIKNTIVKLARIENIDSIRVKRKYKSATNGKCRWWYIIHAEEDTILKPLEATWEYIMLQTGWRLEKCSKPTEVPAVSPTFHSNLNNTIVHETHNVTTMPCCNDSQAAPTVLSLAVADNDNESPVSALSQTEICSNISPTTPANSSIADSSNQNENPFLGPGTHQFQNA